jgi:hypothetical protein
LIEKINIPSSSGEQVVYTEKGIEKKIDIDLSSINSQLLDIVHQIDIVGDGVADDTQSIKNILENATPYHKYQFPPNKTIKITSQITITQPIELDLNGCTVKTYVGAGINTFIACGSISTAHNVTDDITGLTIKISVDDSQNYNVGDYIKITTTENYFVFNGRDYKKGEIVRISAVDKGTGLLTVIGLGTRLTYLASQNTQIAKLNFLDYFKITNGFIYGTGTDNGQVGITGQYIKKFNVSNVTIGFVEVGISPTTCYSADITNNKFIDINKVGTGYGVCITGASRNVNVHHNVFENGRHAITTGGYDGVCIGLDFNHNFVIDNRENAGINTHGNARDVNISDNIIINSNIGISVYSPCSHIHDNIIVNAKDRGIYALEAGGVNIKVKNNYIENVTNGQGISIGVEATTYELNKFVIVEGNEVIGCTNGQSIIIGSVKPQLVSVNKNKLYYCGYEGILIGSGEQIQCDDNLIFNNIRSTQYAINITGTTTITSPSSIYGSTCSIKNNQIPKFAYGINVSTIGTLKLSGNMMNVGLNKYTLTSVTNFEGGDILRSPDGTLYKLNVANGGALTTITI